MILLALLACRGLTVNDVTTGETPEYPEIKPLYATEPPNPVWARVLTVTEELGWECELINVYELACVAETRLVGFEDDVTIRLESHGVGMTKVWTRSRSRVGKGDLGANADRILEFQAAMLAAQADRGR